MIELTSAAVSTIRETFVNIFNNHGLNNNAYYGVSFDSAVIASNTLSRMQAYVTFL
jgi:hypothetical protein